MQCAIYKEIAQNWQVEKAKIGVGEKKSAVFLDFLSLWGHILPYIYRDASQREPAGRSTRAETSTPHPNLRSDGNVSL